MGILERAAIRLVEPLLDGHWRRPRVTSCQTSALPLGRAQAAYGRRGYTSVNLTTTERLRHTLKVGGSGSGKSVSELGNRLHDLATGQPFLLLDCHDTVDKLLRAVARRVVTGQLPEYVLADIWLVSPSHRSWCVHFNPLESTSADAAAEKVALVMKLLETLWGDVFGAQTRQLTQNVLILLAERRVPLADVIGLLHDPNRLRAHALQLVNPRAREYFLTQWFAWSSPRRLQVAEAFVNKIAILLTDPRIAAMLSSPTSDINFRQAMDAGKTILVQVDRGQFFDTVGLLASLILISLQHATFSRGDVQEQHRRPYFVVIEEFPTFASDVTVEPFLNEARKFGVGLVLICQTLASLRPALLSAIRANCHTHLYFRLSPEDARVATSGLAREARELVGRQIVSLPTGSGILLKGGAAPQELRIENTEIPQTLSDRELAIIERIRRNVGRPLSFSAPTPAVIENGVTPTPTTVIGASEDESTIGEGKRPNAQVWVEGDVR